MLFTVSVFYQVFFNAFITFDDNAYVVHNSHIANGVTLDGFLWAFNSFDFGNWHPLAWLSHMLDVRFFGLNPAGHHATSLIIHIANTLLLSCFLVKITGAIWRSSIVALLFAVHPLHVESVAWVAERKDVLCALFWISTMWAYTCYRRTPGWPRYLSVVLLFVLALLSKPMAVTLPLVLLLLDFWPPNRQNNSYLIQNRDNKTSRHIFLEKAPLFFLSIASCVITFYAQKSGGAVGSSSGIALNTGNALISYVAYLIKTVWPSELAIIYPFNADTVTALKVTLSALLMIVITIIAIRERSRRPWLAFGWFWYVITLVPVIGFVRIGVHSMADRYTYLPLIGIFIIIAWGAEELSASFRTGKTVIALLFCAVFVSLMTVTMQQVRFWQNSITLFEHSRTVTRENATICTNLGIAYSEINDSKKAITFLGYAIRIDPQYAEAHYNLGLIYLGFGLKEQTLREYEALIRLNSGYADQLNKYISFMGWKYPS